MGEKLRIDKAFGVERGEAVKNPAGRELKCTSQGW
jgi:hypothetical protein